MIVRFVLVGLMLSGCIGEVSMEDPDILDPEAIRPFTISVPDEVLADLQDRLERTRLPDQIPATGWDYGTNLAYLDELLEYWQEGFDWRVQERQLNEFDHFKTEPSLFQIELDHFQTAHLYRNHADEHYKPVQHG